MNNLIVNTDNTYFLENIEKDIEILVNLYPDFAKKEVIGKSVENRDIISINVGKKSDNPSILLVGGIHAREDFSVMLVMKMLDYTLHYLNNNIKWGDYDVNNILQNINITFLPVLNPDGLNIVHNGLKSSTNYEFLKKIPLHGGEDKYWKANANGVDLNMNFDDGNWYDKLNKQGTHIFSSEGFKGLMPDSEPEVRILKEFCERNNFVLSISYHCSGEVVFWADKGTHMDFNGIDSKIIDRFINYSGYRKTKISEDPKRYGCGFENWFRKRFKRPSYCIELSPFPGKPFIQHEDSKFNELVWDKVKYSGLLFAEEGIRLSNDYYNEFQVMPNTTLENVKKNITNV